MGLVGGRGGGGGGTHVQDDAPGLDVLVVRAPEDYSVCRYERRSDLGGLCQPYCCCCC